MWKILITSAAIAAVAATTGCNRTQHGRTVAAVPPLAAAAWTAPQLAAAEPFEALTETAATASRSELQGAVLKAEAAADAVRRDLPSGAADELTSHIAEIHVGLQTDNRADVALASVEAYRTLVSAAPHAKVPLEVSLLDYAGFRYQADLHAAPVRWADMAGAAAYARAQWEALAPQVADPALRGRMEQAVEALSLAAKARNAAQADEAAVRELDLVDGLEAHFAARAPGA